MIADRQFRIADRQFRIADRQFRIADWKFRICQTGTDRNIVNSGLLIDNSELLNVNSNSGYLIGNSKLLIHNLGLIVDWKFPIYHW